MKAVVFTLGCKVNEVESASIMSALEQCGWEVSPKLCYAEVYVLNTCAVTREAEKKSRQLVARAQKFNPDARIYVCGCASQKDGGQFLSRGVNFVCGARNKQEVLKAISSDFALPCPASLPHPKQVRTRAFVKIGDGCNNFCSYCVIPYLRGRVTSRHVSEVVEEVMASPAQEVVLTGINISAYGTDCGTGLTALIGALAPFARRLRLGSIECNVISEDFLAACKGLQNFAPHFHLSLQSGSNAVLKAMNRRYTREEYLQKCALIYKYFPGAAITTDIIVGFCGETEGDFAQSLSIIKEAGFARVHAFAFSKREGTAAWSLKDIPADVKNERLHRLLAAAAEAERSFILSHCGSVKEIIFEDFDGTYTGGYTPEYIKVYVPGNHSGAAAVKLVSPFKDGALGAQV